MQIQEKARVTNWNLTERSTAAVLVAASSTEDVAAIVANKKQFPSPVLAVGSLHSVNACVTNANGTIVNVSGMNKVLGLEDHGVRAQAGVKLADLHDWLAKAGLEISFSPEIGDATVGSLAVTTSKDSSIDGPGYLSALLTEVKYVDESGNVVTLSKAKTPAELLAFTCSYGMMGVVVEVVLAVRKRIAVTSVAYTAPVASGSQAAAKLLMLYNTHDALFAILVPDRDYVYVEPRKKANWYNALLAINTAVSYIGSVGENNIAKGIMTSIKYKCFLTGDPPSAKASQILAYNRFPASHYRRDFVNRYPAVMPGSQRLDFSYVEFDMANFEAVVAGCWDFHRAYQAKTGYAPGGYGMYFVDRGWNEQQLGDQHRKPHGNFSRPPGISFMLDPITGDCDNPQWLAFNQAYTAWAVSQGAQPSLSQTKGLQPGQVVLPRELTRSRFLTPYYKKFVA